MKLESTNPHTLRSRIWRQRHANDELMEAVRQRTRAYRAAHKDTKEYKERELTSGRKWRLKVRDSEKFRKRKRDLDVGYRARNHGTKIASVRKWKTNNREKHLAQRKLLYAVRVGKLTRPSVCSKCGIVPVPRRDGISGVQAHHYDYSKPLDVQWLCSLCHNTERRKYK